MYSGHGSLRVCLSVCLSVLRCFPTLLHGPGCDLGNGRRGRLVVRCWADLQSVTAHVRKLIALYTANAYSAEREMSASACTRSMAGLVSLVRQRCSTPHAWVLICD